MEQRIEDYFEKLLSDEDKVQFEEELRTNQELADSVAFYLLVKQNAKEDAHQTELIKRHEEWRSLRPDKGKTISRQFVYYAAAAMILIGFGLGWYFASSGIQGRQQLADAYVKENFSTLSVQMDGHADSLQQAINEYNKGEFKQSEKIVEALLKRDPNSAELQKLAGIVSLKLNEYDKAIFYFHQLGEQKNLFSNPGKFYEAIAYIKRDLPLDKKEADRLIQQVIDGNLDGKEEVEKWVK